MAAAICVLARCQHAAAMAAACCLPPPPHCRDIDKAGGIDAYILNTPDKKLQSDVAVELRQKLIRRLLAKSARQGGPAAQQQQQQQQFLPPAAAAAAAAAASAPV